MLCHANVSNSGRTGRGREGGPGGGGKEDRGGGGGREEREGEEVGNPY